MKVQAEVSIYPLKEQSLSGPIEEFCGILNSRHLAVETRSMGTFVSGELSDLFSAVEQAFAKSAEKHRIVMDLKVSNACPQSE